MLLSHGSSTLDATARRGNHPSATKSQTKETKGKPNKVNVLGRIKESKLNLDKCDA